MKSHDPIYWCILSLLFVSGSIYGQIYVTTPACASQAGVGQCSENVRVFDLDTTHTGFAWNIGSNPPNFNRGFNASFPSSGNYTINLSATNASGAIIVQSKNIQVGTYPKQPTFNDKNKADTTVCEGSDLELDPFKGLGNTAPSNVDYLWYPKGETTSKITVKEPGCYSVTVKDKVSGCSRSATINVKICYVPPQSGGYKEKWFFGNKAGVDFTLSGTPLKRDSLSDTGDLVDPEEIEDPKFTPGTVDNSSLIATGSTAIVYDKDQNLAYYSDGKKVFNGQDQEVSILNGVTGSLSGGTNSQGLALVPKPNCNTCDYTQYYLFKVNPPSGLLTYSVIDKRYNEGIGAITEIDVPLLYPVSEKLAVRVTDDEKGFILHAHNTKNGVNYAIKIDSTGININANSTGSSTNSLANYTTQSSISPNGTKYARGFVQGGRNYVEVFDINTTTNNISNPQLIDINIPAPPNIYGITFSPNGDIIYASVSGNPSLGQSSYLVQLALFDGSPATISANRTIISQSATDVYGAVQRGPVHGTGEKYVYLSIQGKDFLPFIQDPDIKGNGIQTNFTLLQSGGRGVDLEPGRAALGLPNITKSPQGDSDGGGGPTYNGNCFGIPTRLQAQGICSPFKNEAEWIFEDGTKKTGLNAVHTFSKVGWNNVKLKLKVTRDSKVGAASGNSTVNNLTQVTCTEEIFDDLRIFIKPSPDYTIKSPIYLCLEDNESKLLDAKPKGGKDFEFDWKTSLNVTISTDSLFLVQIPAPYKVSITNEMGCSRDTNFTVLEGCLPEVRLPNAFSPNLDFINDEYKAFIKYVGEPFDFKIFNRWGELIYLATKIDELNWNGNVRGKTFGNQIYPYVFRFTPKDFPEEGEKVMKGSILILR
ncbi:MAG: gliding motility-associated C-terminal domain-containing protein [Leadbetterella sp.]